MEIMQSSQEPAVSKWATARLIVGIICAVFFPIIAFQSCAVGLGNTLFDNGEGSGFAGILTAVLLLASGIIMIATRKSTKKGASITCCVFLWIGYFLSRVSSSSYSDLRVWGIMAFLIGAFFLITSTHSKKGFWITLSISIVYFVLGIL